MSKILSTFVDGISGLVVPSQDGESDARVHACWNQTHVRTGRLSCTKPNLQNIPKPRTVRGVEVNVRGLFTASRGRVLVSADYSQIEMRVLAHLSGDEGMLRLFQRSGDIYMLLAGLIFRRHETDVSPIERNQAKTVCLGDAFDVEVVSVCL
jgi:DNA polymerase I